jgi:hypothetical protein
MKSHRLAGALLLCLMTTARLAAEEAPLFRVFLKDGSSLVSYGEIARVDERVVFSMPTSGEAANPDLHLVTIPADRVDWDRTTSYSESARATRYLATRAAADYALLTTDIAQALNDVGATTDPAERLAIVQKARRALAEWPSRHFNFKQDEIHQMLGTLDEAIAELRAAAGAQQFDLALVASTPASTTLEPLLPAPTLKEAIEQTLLAARITPSPDERTSLLAVAVATLDRDGAALPADWAAATRDAANAEMERELEIDRSYQSLSARMMKLAASRAQGANVRGVERLLGEIKARDAALGTARPEAVSSLLASVEEQLDAARRLRLARDRWALRLPALRRYGYAIASAVHRLETLQPGLEDIKALAGSAPGTLAALERTAQLVMRSVSIIPAPEECREAHAMLASAAQLASSAAGIRREATLAGDIARAWDASSAAAGALMLTARAQSEIQDIFRLPQLPR